MSTPWSKKCVIFRPKPPTKTIFCKIPRLTFEDAVFTAARPRRGAIICSLVSLSAIKTVHAMERQSRLNRHFWHTPLHKWVMKISFPMLPDHGRWRVRRSLHGATSPIRSLSVCSIWGVAVKLQSWPKKDVIFRGKNLLGKFLATPLGSVWQIFYSTRRDLHDAKNRMSIRR